MTDNTARVLEGIMTTVIVVGLLLLLAVAGSTLDIATGEKHVIATGVIEDKNAHFYRPESSGEFYVSVLKDEDKTTHVIGRMMPKAWHECKVGDRATVYQYRGRFVNGQWFAEVEGSE